MHGPAAPDEQVTGLLGGVVLLRLVVLVWAAVVVAVDITGVTRLDPVLATATLGALAVWTSMIAWCTRHRSPLLLSGPLVPLDVTVAAGVAAMDHLVYDGSHPQTFASAWPLGAVVTAGILRGPLPGAIAGAAVGAGAAAGTALFRPEGLEGRILASAGTMVLLTVAGVLAGVVTDALRRSESTAASARAREDVARQLHDGVLQTLAVVQRRSGDDALVALAREQELELRQFIGDVHAGGIVSASGPARTGGADGRRATGSPAAALRVTAAAAERRTGLRCEVVVVDEPEWITAESTEALCGAVNEAITNADKHGSAGKAVICLETSPEGHAICSVTDDGQGFDPRVTPDGMGLSRSIRGRLSEVGGTVEVDSRPGRGCEVRLCLPRPSGRPARRF